MENETTNRRGKGSISLTIGAITLAVYAVYIGVLLVIQFLGGTILGGTKAGTIILELGQLPAYLGLPFLCAALIANVFGIVMGLLGLRRPPNPNERRRAVTGLALNLTPMLLYIVASILVVLAMD